MADIPSDLQERLAAAGQSHVLAHAASLGEEATERLVADLSDLDLELVRELVELSAAPAKAPAGELTPLPAVTEGSHPDEDAEARKIGEELLRQGKVAAFTVAGGQGTRLGHAGPKGTFKVTPLLGKPLFQVFAERIGALSRRHGATIPWYVMTSPLNHEDTVEFFAENRFFGLAQEDVVFFAQGTMPALTKDGKLILSGPDALFRSPDGHGGSLRAMHTSGALADMRSRGIEEIFYFQVDNPMVRICDPTFLGYHRQTGSDFSSKAVPKRDPFEKVGVLVKAGDSPTVIEYSDLPEELRDARDEDGKLAYRAGNVAIHFIRRAFVEELNRDRFSLPWHIAKKKIPVWNDGSVEEQEGLKFETFVFDALPLAGRTLVMEVERGLDFSPVKNAEGSDSPRTARDDQVLAWAGWLDAAGLEVPRDGEGHPTVGIEIPASFALDAEELLAKKELLPSKIDGDFLLPE